MKSLGLSRYSINSEGEADHLSLEYYVAKDADKEFDALHSLLSDVLKALEPFADWDKTLERDIEDYEEETMPISCAVRDVRIAADVSARIKEVIEKP